MAIYGIVIPSNRHCCSQPLQATVGTLWEVFVWYVTDTSAKLEDKASTERHMQGGRGGVLESTKRGYQLQKGALFILVSNKVKVKNSTAICNSLLSVHPKPTPSRPWIVLKDIGSRIMNSLITRDEVLYTPPLSQTRTRTHTNRSLTSKEMQYRKSGKSSHDHTSR